jgi:ABC-type Na+ transport system ATPase subunit NatA
MNNKCLLTIEEIYSLGLNPSLDYYAQVEPLASNGELANHNSSMKLLFKMAMIVDAQAREIQTLKDDRVAIAQKMVEIEKKNPVVSYTGDATQPLG